MKKYESKIMPGCLYTSEQTIDITISSFEDEEMQQLYIFVTWFYGPSGTFKIYYS